MELLRPTQVVRSHGASEVHNMVLARFMRDEGRDFWRWSAGNRV
jgi:hypothetical protein